jgi:hypothetical protein
MEFLVSHSSAPLRQDRQLPGDPLADPGVRNDRTRLLDGTRDGGSEGRGHRKHEIDPGGTQSLLDDAESTQVQTLPQFIEPCPAVPTGQGGGASTSCVDARRSFLQPAA